MSSQAKRDLIKRLSNGMEPTSTKELLEVLAKVDEATLQPNQIDSYHGLLFETMIQRAREDFLTFVKFMAPVQMGRPLVMGRHVEKICALLQKITEQIERGEPRPDRAMVSLPPQAMKTTLDSILWPAWNFGRNPHWQLLGVADSVSKATTRLGRPLRNLMTTEEFHLVFPECQIRSDSRAAERFNTTAGGEYTCWGAEQQVQGARGVIITVDDIIGEQTAEGPERQRIIDNYIGGIQSRLTNTPVGSEVITGCVLPETPVLMANGTYKRIDQIKEQDEVVTFNNGLKEIKKVVKAWPSFVDRIYKLTTVNGEPIFANKGHPFLVEGKGYIPLEEVKVGDKIIWSLADTHNVRKDLTTEEAWLLGFFFGDGWCKIADRNEKNRPNLKAKRAYTCFAYGVDEDLNKKVLTTLKSLFGVDFFKTTSGYYRSDCLHVAEWFIKHGLVGTAHTKRVPEFIFSQEQSIREAYLLGFVDADGNDRKDGTMDVTSCNPDLLLDLKRLAQSCGWRVGKVRVRTRICQAPNSPKPTVSTCASITLSVIQRKNNLFDFTKVLAIEDTGEDKMVWDMEVEDNHNFIIGGLVCHNTRFHPMDLHGYLQKEDNDPNYRPWTIIKVPAILDKAGSDWLRNPDDPPELYKVGTSFWPEFQPQEKLENTRAKLLRTYPTHWHAIYQQNPVSKGGTNYKYNDFNKYTPSELPEFKHISVSLDCAVSTKTRSDFTGIVTIGAFIPRDNPELFDIEEMDNADDVHLMVLKAEEVRLDVFDLLKKCHQINLEDRPDMFVVENAAGGISLISELKKQGLPVIGVQPNKDKIFRSNKVVPFVRSGKIWVLDGCDFTEQFLEHMASFPQGAHDDMHDAFVQQVSWYNEQTELRMFSSKFYNNYQRWDEDDDEEEYTVKTIWEMT